MPYGPWKAGYFYLLDVPGIQLYPSINQMRYGLGAECVRAGCLITNNDTATIPTDDNLANSIRPGIVYIFQNIPVPTDGNTTNYLVNIGQQAGQI